MSAIKLAQKLYLFIKANKLTLSISSLKHDLVHVQANLGISLQDEVTVLCLQRGCLLTEEKANKAATELAKFHNLPNDFSYSLLVKNYPTYKVEHISDEVINQIATILNIK